MSDTTNGGRGRSRGTRAGPGRLRLGRRRHRRPTAAPPPARGAERPEDRHQVRPAGPRPEEGHASTPASTSTWRPTSPRSSARDAANITWVQAPSAQRETLISTGQVDMVVATYSITDARKEKVSFAGPYFVAGQDLLVRADDTSITGPDSLDGKKLCSVTGSTSAQKVKDELPGRPAAGVRHLLRVPPGPGQRRRRRPDHRRHDPRRLRRPARVQGQVQGRRQAVLRGALRHRPEEGRHRHLREGQRRDHARWSRTARGRRPSTPTSARPATSRARATRRRPTACS